MAQKNKQIKAKFSVLLTMGHRKSQKKPRNISGLRNQPSAQLSSKTNSSCLPENHHVRHCSDPESDTAELSSGSVQVISDLEKDGPFITGVHFDSMKPDFALEELTEGESDVEEAPEWDELDDENLAESLASMATDDSPDDADWIPAKLQRRAQKHKGACARHLA